MNGSSSNKKLIILAMALGLLMSSLDNTIVASCISKLSEDFNVFDKISWVFTAYMLAATSTMLIFGKMSDLFGRKMFYMIGIGLFLIGSALCGVAQSVDQLIWFRVIQGIGSGALFPISFTIIYTIFSDPKDAAKMSGVFGAIFGLSSVAGPQLGSFIAEHLGWRWNFYINVPIGLASMIVLMIALKETRSERKPKIDYLGTIFLVITTVSLMLALEWGGKDYAWSSWQEIGLFAVSVIFGTLFIMVELRASEPVLPLSIFKNKMVLGTSIIVFCQGVLMFSAITYLPIFTVAVLGHTNSNGVLTPMMASLIAGAILFGFLQSKFAFRTLMLVSMSMTIIVAWLLTIVSSDASSGYMILLMILLGLGAIGPLMSVAQSSIAANVDPKYMGVSSSIVGFWRSIGGIMGASIMATIVNNNLHQLITDGAAKAGIPADKISTLANPELLMRAGGTISPEIREFLQTALATAINHGFILSICIGIVGFITALFVGSSRLEASKKQQTSAVHV
ncbi:DHA2 family efflux MFS transporter permease subunit [Paenibacillus sp. HWE-109]|uniref:DHA2 family efflux MFS transporter permease subunit n=1 Tax=Paenibacillus sp. HWE-109 TaxID=1306526 RepID=UPI001EDFB925|nr:DHA2 family efflux MFS transporter permease subunit [Paenibacillus sp. HWE-109]UKS27149.1 DHA2 family efflux MFS transporter permease subunit [Paenibacillus sp. HWE-109]